MHENGEGKAKAMRAGIVQDRYQNVATHTKTQSRKEILVITQTEAYEHEIIAHA